MMEYAVACACGETIYVSAGEAGGMKQCECGQEVSIPPLSVLRANAVQEPKHHQERQRAGEQRGSGSFVGITVFLVAITLVAPLLPPPYVALIGFSMTLLGRLWFALLIFGEMTFANALIVFFVPLMPTIFFFQRIEVTWKPFVFGLMGYFLLAFSLPLVKS